MAFLSLFYGLLVIGLQLIWNAIFTVQKSNTFQVKATPVQVFKSNRKPDWVVDKVIQLKANDLSLSCRKLSDSFNRQYVGVERISHQTVNNYLRRHQADVLLKRQQLKRRQPVIGVKNRVWGMDLTGKQVDGKVRYILGAIDHGTRSNVILQVVQDKSSLVLLQCLFKAIKRYGKPQVIRTDNEAVFCSRLFRWSLSLLGIKHQRIDLACPWQNGRIERLFGTLKQKLNQVEVDNTPALAEMIKDFRFWYNHIRTHQSLLGFTPAEVWSNRQPKRFAIPYSGWGGLLKGYYHPY